MAAKDRLEGLAFTCSNRRFKTNIAKGQRHGTKRSRGSVFRAPLVSSNGYTLWLEHVVDKRDDSETFWLMWYDPEGSPTIPLSGVISADDIKAMSSRLAELIDL